MSVTHRAFKGAALFLAVALFVRPADSADARRGADDINHSTDHLAAEVGLAVAMLRGQISNDQAEIARLEKENGDLRASLTAAMASALPLNPNTPPRTNTVPPPEPQTPAAAAAENPK